MTAINLFKTSDAACLLTDLAWMSGGKLVAGQSKVAACPRLLAAVAVQGNVTPRTCGIIDRWLNEQPDQVQAVGYSLALVDLVRADAEKDAGHTEEGPARLFIALWRQELSRPEIYVADDKLQGVNHCFGPPSAVPMPAGLDRPALIARIEDQRRQRTDIGVGAELTVITANGVHREIIHRWPDKLGEPITPWITPSRP